MLQEFSDPKVWQLAGSVLARCGVAVLLAGIIGWEREKHGRPAGVRTHMLVALGTALFSIVGEAFGGDPGRVAAQVVTGIGFLGAGTIMRMGAEVKGLTTAASVWATAGIAMAVSVGGAYLIVAVFGTVLALLTLALVDDLVRRYIRHPKHRRLEIIVDDRAAVSEVLSVLSSGGLQIMALQVLSNEGDIELSIGVDGEHGQALSVVSQIAHVKMARWLD